MLTNIAFHSISIRVSDIPGKAKKRDPGKKIFHSRDPGNSRETDRRFTLKDPKGYKSNLVCKINDEQ